ncbi:MAG: HAMP domain-containing histidine kinase [Clostridia bacterium]|nr:HAMP domain-containing histidine kinase [Clostridia bacterium]
MKKNGVRSSKFSFAGAALFFVSIALMIQIAVMLYDYIAQKTDNKPLIALLMLVVIVLLSGACTLIDIIRRRWMIDKPVDRILQATEKIASGDFSVRLEITRPYGKYTEYDVIMENLNTLAAELGKTEVLKTDFISNVSHELKTPLTIIHNYATLLQDDTLDSDSRKKYAKTLSQASKRLSDLITNILKLNKLENQEVKPEYETLHLTEELASSVLQYEEIIETKNLVLECDLDDVWITSSKPLLELVWNNLLSNAVKFTETGGRVEVTLKKEGLDAVVKVSDTGCGISPEKGARIFEKFYQGDTSHSQEGNGLGLALVKRVIDILGGEISVKSEAGKGSTFTVVLRGTANEV